MAVECCGRLCTARLPEVSVVFQPVLHVPDLSVYGYEALCRVAGDVAPLFAEAVCGSFAQALDKEVCRQAVPVFARSGSGVLFVNLTLPTFLSCDGVAEVLSGLPRGEVVVEVTEQALDTLPGKMRRAAPWWRRRGFMLAVDDVGSGQCRVLALAEVVPDFVKVDRPLLAGARESGVGRTVLGHVVALARSLGAQVVAEGVETEAELELMRGLGFDLVQGYLLGRPGPLSEL